jgi:hypothetical protein
MTTNPEEKYITWRDYLILQFYVMSARSKQSIKNATMRSENKFPKDIKTPKKKSFLLETAKDYASSTTAHGLPHIVEEGYSITERVFWTIVVLLAFVFILYQTSNLYTDWQDNPVVTSLDTVALPIEKISFPAVTICPQGSVNSIMSKVLFKQFTEYMKKKQPNRTDITVELMMKEASTFLHDVYPGAKDSPIKLVSLMTSDDPKKTVESKAVLKQDDDSGCDSSEKITDALNKQLSNDSCPSDFEVVVDNGCIHTGGRKMTYNEATDYCNQKSGSELLYFDSYQGIESFQEYQAPGRFPMC